MSEPSLSDAERETWLAGLRTAERVRQAIADHFIMWRELTAPIGPSGEWFCACGLKFGFSDTAIDHQATEVERIVAARVAVDVDRERAAWVAKVEALESVVNAIDDEHYAEAPRYCNEGACRTCDHITRLNAGLLAADDTEAQTYREVVESLDPIWTSWGGRAADDTEGER